MFLKDAIINHRLTVTEMQQAIAGFPLYVRTPTLELLNELFVRNLSFNLILLPGYFKFLCSIGFTKGDEYFPGCGEIRLPDGDVICITVGAHNLRQCDRS